MKLPTWKECEVAFAENGWLDPLQRFVLDNEPAGSGDEQFRQQLANLIEFVKMHDGNPVAWKYESIEGDCWYVPLPPIGDTDLKITPLYTHPSASSELEKAAVRLVDYIDEVKVCTGRANYGKVVELVERVAAALPKAAHP